MTMRTVTMKAEWMPATGHPDEPAGTDVRVVIATSFPYPVQNALGESAEVTQGEVSWFVPDGEVVDPAKAYVVLRGYVLTAKGTRDGRQTSAHTLSRFNDEALSTNITAAVLKALRDNPHFITYVEETDA